jgi:hypothetical protein
MPIKKTTRFLITGGFVISLLFFSCDTLAATTIYVGNRNADYICDGRDDQVQINEALKKAASMGGAVVYLRGPFTYEIRDTLYIGDNTTVTGDPGAVLKLGNNLKWKEYQAMFQQMNQNGNKNIKVYNLEFDGNLDNLSKIVSYGKGYFNFFYMIRCSNVEIYNNYMHSSQGDGYRGKWGNGIKFYNNRVENLGHDGLFCLNMTNVEAFNNQIATRANSGIRITDSNHVRIYNNYITSGYLGNAGVQLESRGQEPRMNSIQVYNNIFENTYGPGIWMIRWGQENGRDRSYAYGARIAGNKFIGCGVNKIDWNGGLVVDGWEYTVIENNVFDGCHGAAIVHRHPQQNIHGESIAPPESGYTTIVRDNEIKNTRPHKAGNGIGVYNYNSRNRFLVHNNQMQNNPGGNYVGDQIIEDPASQINKYTFKTTPNYSYYGIGDGNYYQQGSGSNDQQDEANYYQPGGGTEVTPGSNDYYGTSSQQQSSEDLFNVDDFFSNLLDYYSNNQFNNNSNVKPSYDDSIYSSPRFDGPHQVEPNYLTPTVNVPSFNNLTPTLTIPLFNEYTPSFTTPSSNTLTPTLTTPSFNLTPTLTFLSPNDSSYNPTFTNPTGYYDTSSSGNNYNNNNYNDRFRNNSPGSRRQGRFSPRFRFMDPEGIDDYFQKRIDRFKKSFNIPFRR